MSALEQSVQTLANALDSLENRLAEKIAEASGDADAIEAAERQANTAKAHLNEASIGLAASIRELQALIDTDVTPASNNKGDEHGAS